VWIAPAAAAYRGDLTKGEAMFKRSISRRAAVLIAGTTIASTVYAQGAAASPADQRPTPQGQSGVAVGAVAPPAVQPASDQAPDRGAVSPRSHTFKHCGNRRVCIFRGANYRIWKVTFGANYAGVWRWILISDGVALRHYSAKNRFGNRRLLLRGTRADGTWRRYCLNPKTNRPGPLRPGMLQFKIGAVGSRC
jgi:hypothetical protein